MINNIKISNTQVWGWTNAIKGMRYPMDSEKESDSFVTYWELRESEMYSNHVYLLSIDDLDSNDKYVSYFHNFSLKDDDKELLLKLCKAGTDHRKVLRMIHVQMSVAMPLFWWKEFDTYKIGVTANSRSTMHKLGSRTLSEKDFAICKSHEYAGINPTVFDLDEYNKIILMYQEALGENKKQLFRKLVEYLPSSYIQERMVDFNYEVALNIYFARRNHKLEEWHFFCNELLMLPYFKNIIEYMEI